MKPNLILLSLLLIPAAASLSFAQTALTADSCRTLTAENTAACCNAPNWRDIVSSDAQASCASDNEQKVQQPSDNETVGSVTSPAEAGGTTTPAAAATGGNPGNSSPVGESGEKGMNSESPSTGTKGSSN